MLADDAAVEDVIFPKGHAIRPFLSAVFMFP
jgi:hypothetical protein